MLELDKYPHLSSVKNMFVRGSVVRYVMLPRSEVDVGLLEDATRRGKCASICLMAGIDGRCSFLESQRKAQCHQSLVSLQRTFVQES